MNDDESIQKFTRDQCIEKLKERGWHGAGALGEMKMRLKKFSSYRLKLKAQRECNFQ